MLKVGILGCPPLDSCTGKTCPPPHPILVVRSMVNNECLWCYMLYTYQKSGLPSETVEKLLHSCEAMRIHTALRLSEIVQCFRFT